ncbi:hypothetical protein TIFTF001_002543 [Ficus carica]|uniref:non-specific serine/threonine protein kinase n=1 Tax=Ficus carica TaxID=3494 RepID=A0AA87ZBE0_FICCA|nr:hypothetical protein TIFTF001_002543 [Ficus carica]
MEISFLSTHTLCLLLLFFIVRISAQSPPPTPTAGTNFSCSANSRASCDTYVAYFAQSPDFMDLKSISGLFGVNSSLIAEASNLVSESTELIPGQLLLVPVTCSCNGSQYFANISYDIKMGDSYFIVSRFYFQNLTNWQVVLVTNPTLKPNLLKIGTKVIFPLFCGCPSKTQSENGIKHLITYVWQPGDDVFGVSTKFNASEVDIITENNYGNFSDAVGSPVLIPVSRFPALSQPHPSRKRNTFRHRWILIAVMSSAGALLALILVTFLVYTLGLYETKKLVLRNDSDIDSSDLIQMKKLSETEKFELQTKQDKLLPGVSGYLGKPIVYDIETIMQATMNLNELCRIGGSVYKAMIDGKVFAVKKAKEDIKGELQILQKVNHGNLVNLLGISSNSEANFLVYEYAENGSLDEWLHSKSSTSSSSMRLLTWNQRLHIALDIANGLQYVHEHTQPSIVHQDIRTSNVLLDTKFKAKIANFSMARLATNSTMPKVDVFAFGVVILELLSGRKAMATNENGEIVMLWKEAREVLEGDEKRADKVREWMDPKLERFYPIDGALSLITLAKACTEERSSVRPSMGEVVFSLSVLTQSFSETSVEGSWTCTLEAEDVVQITSPLTAR